MAGKFGEWKEKISQKRAKNKRNAKGGKWIIIIVILLAAVIAGALLWQRHTRNAAAASAAGNAKNTATVTKGNLTSSLSSSGTLAPKDTYEITSLVEGDVIFADFEEGDQVSEGQILYQIDSSSMESNLLSAQNSLTRAQESYELAVTEYNDALSDYSGNTYKATRTGYISKVNITAGDRVSANTEIGTLYNDQVMKIKIPFLSLEAAYIGAGMPAVLTLTDTEEQLIGTVISVSNMESTLEGGRLVKYVTIEVQNPGGLTVSHTATAAIGDFAGSLESSFEPVTDTTLKADDLDGTVEVETVLVHDGDYVTVGTPLFRMTSKDAEDILRNYKDSMDNAQEKVESAQSTLDNQEDTYGNYTITAPISGQVITKTSKVGDKISRSSTSSSTTMAVIYDLSELTFEMSVDELDVQSVQVGQKVEVTADAVENKTFTGTVTNISLQSSYSNGVTNYPVTVTMDDADGLLPGMNVDGVIILDEVSDTLMVPVDALMRGNRVYIKDDTVTEQQGNVPAGFRSVEVETGLMNDDYVEILSGVSEGDTVYVSESSATTSFMMPGMGGSGGMGGERPSGGGQGGGRPSGGRGGMGGSGGMR